MIDVEFNWEDGEVSDFWLSVGLVKNTAHLYQTPWTGETWWIESLVFNIDKAGFDNIILAKKAVEQTAIKWFQMANHKSPIQENMNWIFTDNM